MVYHDECKNCRCCVVAGSGELHMQDVVETDVIGHGRRGIFLFLGDISQSFKLCCACFPCFFGVVGSESKGEMVWPASVWQMFLGAIASVLWSVIPKSWHGWWLRSVTHDIFIY